MGQSLIRIGSFGELSGLALLWIFTHEVAVRGRACDLFSVPSVPPWFISLLEFIGFCDALTSNSHGRHPAHLRDYSNGTVLTSTLPIANGTDSSGRTTMS